MTDVNVLYIPIKKVNGVWRTTIEGLIVLFIYKWSGSEVTLNFVEDCPDKGECFICDVEQTVENSVSWESLAWEARLTTLPLLSLKATSEVAQVIVSGLSAVSRCILKLCPSPEINQALGFRQNCLQASAETSVWTHFCEVAMPRAVTRFLEARNFASFEVPAPVAQFEEHLKQPVRMHNVVKRWQDDTGTTEGTHTKQVQKMIPLWMEHTFAEGPDMTLADLVLFPCVQLFLKLATAQNLSLDDDLPHTLKWHKKMSDRPGILQSWYGVTNTAFDLNGLRVEERDPPCVIMPQVAKESLYKKDTSRDAKDNVCTENLESAVAQLRDCNLFAEDARFAEHFDVRLKQLLDVDIDTGKEYKEHVAWETLPAQAHPRLGQVPGSRLNRKIQQLDNMAHSVMLNCREGDIIVEFCSGSGHLGVVLAYLLPKCRLVLVDNKEESVIRARKRAAALELKNVTLIQSNLDYFCGEFSLGVALHACGVATDLVLKTCLSQRASFVLCPCCYGNLAGNLPITYPQSTVFEKSISPSLFFCVSRAADDVTPVGKSSMNSVDLDRALKAVESGYRVRLTKLIPEACTPKHNLLIGVPTGKLILAK